MILGMIAGWINLYIYIEEEMIMITLLCLQWALLIVQISCVVYAMRKDKSPFDVLCGFGVWGCIPVIILMLYYT